MAKDWLARGIVALDDLSHVLNTRTGLPHSVALCLAADVVYGWGPDAADWTIDANRFHRWLHRTLQ